MNHCHFCGNNIPDEVDTCAQANYACDGPRTKESNTPDTEWEGVEELGNIGKNIDAVREKLNEVIRGLNKIERLTVSRDTYWKNHEHDMYETLEKENREQTIIDIARVRDERDTYWKERVRKEVEGMKRKITFNGSDESGFIQYGQVIDSDCEYNQALDTLLDNLK